MKIIVLFVCLLLVIFEYPKGVQSISIDGGKISNGEGPAGPGEFPYVVSVTDDIGQHICGGFIYNNYWIVTAASCVLGKTPRQVNVVAGQLSLIQQDPGEQILQGFAIHIYEGYDSVTKMHDIALVQVVTPFDLYGTADFIYYGEVDEGIRTTTFMGWGATVTGGAVSIKLQKASLPLSNDCPRNYTVAEYDAKYMICAGDAVSQPCQYDEGSPLVQGTTAIGIYSKNKGCSNSTAPSVFTRLSAYFPWMLQHAGEQGKFTTTTGLPTAPCQECVTPPLS